MKKKRKILMVSIISFLILMIGLVFNRLYQIKNLKDNIKVETISNRPKKYRENQVSNDWQSIKNAQKNAIKDGVSKNAYGILKIPSIDLALPIFIGSNEYTLSLGVATFQYENAKAGIGNLILAGHTTPYKDVLFTNLHNVKKGAEVFVETKDKTFSYIVDDIKVADSNYKTINGQPTNSLLQLPKTNEEPKITLVTCSAWNDSSTRFLVSGHLKK